MKDVEVEEDNCPGNESSRRRIKTMAIKSENCHQRLQALQEKFHAMEDLVSNMVQYKAKIGQLKQERFNLSVTYEDNLQKYRVQVSELERENMMLLNDLKKLEAQCLPKEPQEENQVLMERLKILESKSSHLVLENDRQRVQYEKCLDEIANQVVQALIVQKTLKEECCQLQERVHDLEIQNQQLNLLFKQQARPPAESVLKFSPPSSSCSFVHTAASEEAGDRPQSQLDIESARLGFQQGAESLQSLCSNYSYEDNVPRMSTPPPWLRDELIAHSDKLNAFSDRLSILSNHVTEAQIQASTEDALCLAEFMNPSSNPDDLTAMGSSLKISQSRASATVHVHESMKSKQYATVRPLNCQQLPSLNAGESAISQEQSGWKMDFATISKGLTHQFDQDMYSDDETETMTVTKKSSHVLSPNDILENSLDALATPENETGHQEPFPVFRTDICHRKNGTAQMGADFEKLRGREKISEPRKRCSGCKGNAHPESLSHDGILQTIIPNVSRPDTLDLSPPTHNSDSPSQEDSQTSPLSPYLTKRYSRKKVGGGLSECESNCCRPRQPSSSSSLASASHYSNTTGPRHKSRKEEHDSQKGRKSKNSNYYSPDDPPPSYLAFMTPFQQKANHPSSKKLPVCAYGLSKSHDAEIRHSKVYHNGLEHSGQNVPFAFNKKTLPDVYLTCSEWRKNVMTACANEGEAMNSELKKLCSISSDSSYESIKAEHSGSRDDGYSTMSSDMQPEMLERFSDSAMMKRMSGRNSIEMTTDCCGKIVPHVNKSNIVALSRNNRASSSPTDSEHSSDLNGTGDNFNSQEFFSSSTIVSSNRKGLTARKPREERLHTSKQNCNEARNADNCMHTFPKFCCPSKRKSLLEASTSSSSSSFHQSAKSLHCSSDYSPGSHSLESSSRFSFLLPDASNTNGCDRTARKLCRSSDTSDRKKVPLYSRFTFPASQRFQTPLIKRTRSDSHLFVKISSKSAASLRDSLLFGNLDNSISDCTISLSDLSPSRSSQSPLPLTGSLRRSPWQPLVNVDQHDNKLGVQSKWLQKKLVLKTENSTYNESKAHHTLGNNQSYSPAVDHIQSACHPNNTNKNIKENISSSSSSPFHSPDETKSAEQWLLQFSKEDIEKNLAFYQKRQNQSLHNGHTSHSPSQTKNVEDDHTVYWQTMQHKPHPTRIPVSRYMTLPICNPSPGLGAISRDDDSIPLSPVSPSGFEEQKKFRQEFYSLCCMESNRSLFSGCSHEENLAQKLLPLTNTKSEDTCHGCSESDIQEIENVSLQIDHLSRTVNELHLSFSSLNSIECNSDVGSGMLTPASGHNSSLEGYHWVEDEFYLTPSSGDIIFSNSNDSSASCEWMNEYVDESVEAFYLPESCDDDQHFMEKLCAVANKSVDEGKISGGKEKMSTPEKEVDDILVTNPQTRADLLDAMIDVSPANGSDDSSSADDRMSVSKFKNKKGRQKTSAQTSPSLNFQRLFTRFGYQEEEAVSAFDFLDQFSTSSANSEPPLMANVAEYVASLPQEFQNYSPLSDPDVTPHASPTKCHKVKKGQLPSKKDLKHLENCSRSNQAKAAAAAATATATTTATPVPSTSSRDLCRSYSTCSLESPEDGSASNLSLSDSCCE